MFTYKCNNQKCLHEFSIPENKETSICPKCGATAVNILRMEMSKPKYNADNPYPPKDK